MRSRLPQSIGLVAFLCGWVALAGQAWSQVEGDVPDEPDPGKPILALDTGGHTNAVYKLLVSGYANQLISVGLDKTIRLWDLDTGEPLQVLRPPMGNGAHGYLFSAAISPDGKLLAVGTYRALTPLFDHRIHLIELPSGEMVHSLKGHVYTIYDLAFSADGKRLASASHDSTVRIWNVETGESEKTLQGHTGPVHGVAWSRDGKQIVSGSLDKTARIWSIEKGTTTAVLREHQDEIMTVAWSPDGRTIATGCDDKTIRLYEPSGKLRFATGTLRNEIESLKFSPDSKRILYTYGSNTKPPIGSAVLDLSTLKQIAHYSGHENSPISSVFTPDGKRAVTGDSISRIRMWNAATGATLHKLDGRGQTMFGSGWSRDGQAISWGTKVGEGKIDAGGPLERTFCFRNLDFGPPPDKTFVRARPALGGLQMGLNVAATPVNMRKVYFMQGESVLNTFTLPQPYDQVRCYSLLPGNRAVIGTHDGAYLIDVKKALIQHHMTDRGEELWGLAPSPDFRYVLTSGNDQILRVWRVDTGELLLALFVADEEWIAWSPHGYYAASLAGESLMGWHLNRGPEKMADFYPASQFHKSLYRPDVIRRLLEAGDLTKAVELADRERKEESRVVRVADVLPAEVTITEPGESPIEQKESKLTVRSSVEATAGQPITAMQLIVNGRPHGAARPIAASPDPAGAGKIEQEWNVELPPGKYSIAVKAESAKSYALSPSVEVTRPPEEGGPRPKLFVLSVDPSPKGAAGAAVSKALQAAGSGLFDKVETRVLAGDKATPAAINAELEKIKSQATLADTTLIYYAGQEAIDSAGKYRLSAAKEGGKEPAGAWLSDDDLKRELAAIPGRLLLALDTTRSDERFERTASTGFCGSSAQEHDGSKLDGAACDFLRDMLTEEFGIVVLRAARRAPAAKGQPEQSPFSKALVEAVGGRADTDQDGVVYLHELSRYVNQRVRELSGGKQVPIVERPRGVRTFPLTKPPTPPPAPPKR